MSLMLSCEINRITISNRRGKEFALYNKGVVCGGNGGTWATEQMRLRLLCFPEHGDLSARAAAHARAAAVKVRAIGFLSDATASVFTSEPFPCKGRTRRLLFNCVLAVQDHDNLFTAYATIHV